jgi:hypothetical protein
MVKLMAYATAMWLTIVRPGSGVIDRVTSGVETPLFPGAGHNQRIFIITSPKLLDVARPDVL